MAHIGCRIYTEICRAAPELVALFAGLPVANIADNMNRIACPEQGLLPLNSSPLLGTAFTVRCPGGDNLMMHKALDMAKPGDIIVVSPEGHVNRALCGEIMIRYAMKRGLAGLVIDGAIRDADAARKLDFPVYARSVQANGPYKNGPGEINTPVSIGGAIVYPGDIIIGDGDGLVAVRAVEAGELAEKTRKTMEIESKSFADIEAGTWARGWIDAKLAEVGCQVLNTTWDDSASA